jgi:hypothetical protein
MSTQHRPATLDGIEDAWSRAWEMGSVVQV